MPKVRATVEQAIIRDLNKHIESLKNRAAICRKLAETFKASGLQGMAEREYERARRLESALHELQGVKKEILQIFNIKEAEG